jgi:hypothetical protein
MGGYGSGRWRGGKPDRKTVVESCLALDINALARARVVRPNVDLRGAWKWWNQTEDDQDPEPEKNKPSAAIGFHVRTRGDSGSIKLDYSATVIEAGGSRAAALMSYPIALETSGLPSGGLRWWFICPAQRGEDVEPCRRRVGKLFLPRGRRVFACRHCYDLTYTSCRESRRLTGIARMLAADCRIPPQNVERMLREEDRERDRRRREPFQGAVFA